MSAYEGFQHNVTFVNMNFKIKVNIDSEYGRVSTLLGVSGLINLIGVDIANRIVDRALKSDKQVYKYRLRRGCTIRFYSH